MKLCITNFEKIKDTLLLNDYLQPNCSLIVEDKCQMFAIRSETNDLPSNFGKSEICCKIALNNEQIIICQRINEGIPFLLGYDKILNWTLSEKIAIFKQFQINKKKKGNIIWKWKILNTN